MNTMLHLGLGSFHRAHQAVYLHELIETGDASLGAGRRQHPARHGRDHGRAGGAGRRLHAGDHLAGRRAPLRAHHLDPQGDPVRRRPGRSDRRAAPTPATTIISFTVTEAGYYLDAKNRLDLNFADLAADLQAAQAGRPGSTIYAALTAILRARSAAGAGPVTLLNCDNLRHNGDRSRSGLLQFIELLGDADLRALGRGRTPPARTRWSTASRRGPRPTCASACRPPPASTTRRALMGESFIQWVIEDRFVAGRPAWEKVGVRDGRLGRSPTRRPRSACSTPRTAASPGPARWRATCTSTRARTTRQIRQHGATTTSPTTRSPACTRPSSRARSTWRAYRDVVLDRFGNPAIRDTNQRVAMDGFSKIPGFIAPTIRERLARERVDRQRGDAAGAVPGLPAALAPRADPLHLPGPGDGPGARRMRSARRPTRWPPSAPTGYCSGPIGRRRAPGRCAARPQARAWPISCSAAAP